jgi:hypothetical protein
MPVHDQVLPGPESLLARFLRRPDLAEIELQRLGPLGPQRMEWS